MTTAVAVPESKTLFALCDDLQTYFDTLEMVEAQLAGPLPDDERPVIERQRDELKAALDRIGCELATKTDSVAGVLRRIKAEIGFLEDEQDRIRARRKSFERAEDWLRKYVLAAMLQHGQKQLKTASNTLFLRQSDGVVVTDAEAIPAEYKSATVKLPLWLWHSIVGVVASFGPLDVKRDIDALRVSEECSLSAIKKALKAGDAVPGADLEFRDSLVLR